MVPGPGLEPGYSASKADVLPIRRSRNNELKFTREVLIRPNCPKRISSGRKNEAFTALEVNAELCTNGLLQHG
jgi:hypothetical protein